MKKSSIVTVSAKSTQVKPSRKIKLIVGPKVATKTPVKQPEQKVVIQKQPETAAPKKPVDAIKTPQPKTSQPKSVLLNDLARKIELSDKKIEQIEAAIKSLSGKLEDELAKNRDLVFQYSTTASELINNSASKARAK